MTKTKERPATGCAATGGCEVIRRGPNWLFVRVPGERAISGRSLANQLWEISQQHFTNRLVVEIDADDVSASRRAMIRLGADLRRLHDRLAATGGALRLCGMRAEQAHDVLEAAHCAGLHNHPTPLDAVTGSHTLDG